MISQSVGISFCMLQGVHFKYQYASICLEWIEIGSTKPIIIFFYGFIRVKMFLPVLKWEANFIRFYGNPCLVTYYWKGILTIKTMTLKKVSTASLAEIAAKVHHFCRTLTGCHFWQDWCTIVHICKLYYCFCCITTYNSKRAYDRKLSSPILETAEHFQ